MYIITQAYKIFMFSAEARKRLRFNLGNLVLMTLKLGAFRCCCVRLKKAIFNFIHELMFRLERLLSAGWLKK